MKTNRAKLFAFLVLFVSSMMIIIMAVIKASVPPDPAYWVGMCGFALLDVLSMYFLFVERDDQKTIDKGLDFSELSRPPQQKGFTLDQIRKEIEDKKK